MNTAEVKGREVYVDLEVILLKTQQCQIPKCYVYFTNLFSSQFIDLLVHYSKSPCPQGNY